MGSRRKNRFGETIEFDEIFSRVIYVDRNNLAIAAEKLYEEEGRVFPIVESQPRIDDFTSEYFPPAYRKIVFQKTKGSGIIVGQTKKIEGAYHTVCAPYGINADPTDFEPAYTECKLTYTFWVVAVGMNATVLVPK
jgi:hypothetical protein